MTAYDWKSVESSPVLIEPNATKPFDLMAAKQEAALKSVIAHLNRDLFTDEMYPAPTRWDRVRAYCSTLWRAMKGEHPYDDC